MSTAVMSSPMFECGELFKNASSSKQHQQQKEAQAMLREAAAVAAAAAASSNVHAPLRRSYTSLVNLIEQHRKLDRTVSEPTSRYKTELCRPFEENGSCKYGDKCQFAHGSNELRNLARHPKYKTELCRTFHKIGFCPYGPRCHFVHNFEEARIHNLKVSAQLGHQQHQAPLGPLLPAAAASLGVNMNLLEHLATSPQLVAAVAAASGPLARASSLNVGLTGYTQMQSSPAAHVSLHRSSSLGVRPKPLNLSPTFSLGSSIDSISPSSSLSQSPTNSMASFFSDDLVPGRLVGPAAAFGFAQDLALLGTGARQSPSPQAELASPRTPSPLSPGAETRLPVFNRISRTIADLEHLKI